MNWNDGTPKSEHNAFDLSEPSEFCQQWVQELTKSSKNSTSAKNTKEVQTRQQISIDPFAELSTVHNQMIRKAKI